MDNLLHDIRYGLRTFIAQPIFSLTAVAALALGIGANTAVFSVVYAALLAPLPFAHPEQLVYVHDTFPSVPNASVSWPKFMALRDGTRTLSGLASYTSGGVSMTGRGEPVQLVSARVSGDFFRVLDVPPVLGRPLLKEDDVPNGGKVVELSYGLWTRRFGQDPKVIGQAVAIGGEPFTIAGVMPASFNYPTGTQAWVPLALPDKFQGNNFLRLIGRARPGASLSQVQDDLGAISTAFNDASKLKRGVAVSNLQEYLTRGNRQTLVVLQGTVAFVLLIACANVANLLLARSVTRTRELSIRAAIGAGRFRLVQQLLTESVLLALAGGVAGVLLASWLLRLFLALAPANFIAVQTIGIDMPVLLTTLAIAVATGLIFGLAPARQGFQIDPNGGLRDTGARGATSGAAKGLSRVLVVAEVGMAMMLAVGAALMVKSLLKIQAQDPGFQPQGRLTFQLNLPAARYQGARAVQTYDQILDQIRGIPGVEGAGAVNMLPLQAFGFNSGFGILGRPPLGPPDRAPIVEFRFITPGYLQAMGIAVVAGRGFDAHDTAASTPVCLINAVMAQQFWPEGSPIGSHLNFGPGPANQPEIVGVVGDMRSLALSVKPVSESYYPLTQSPTNGMAVVVRTDRGDSTALLPAIRQRLAQIDPDLPIVSPLPLQTVVDASTGTTRLSSVLTLVFGMLAAILAAVGIYSLIAYSVAQRTREIGIRIALGADRTAIVRLILGEAVVLGGIGVGMGLIGAAAMTGALKALLYEVSPLDPAILALTSVGVMTVTVLASYIPARRALRVDPTSALRAS